MSLQLAVVDGLFYRNKLLKEHGFEWGNPLNNVRGERIIGKPRSNSTDLCSTIHLQAGPLM